MKSVKAAFSRLWQAAKRFVLLVVFFGVLGGVLKTYHLRRQGAYLSQACAKLLDLRLVLLEEKFYHLAEYLAQTAGAGGRKLQFNRAGAMLHHALLMSPYLQEIIYIAGQDQDGLRLTRTQQGIEQVLFAGPLSDSSLHEARQKGRIVVAPIIFDAPQADGNPRFQIAYPVDGPHGGLLVATVQLWDFLKQPTAMAREIVPRHFDLEIWDKNEHLLAYKRSGRSSHKFLFKHLQARSAADKIQFFVDVRPNREALFTVFNSRYAILALGLALPLAVIL